MKHSVKFLVLLLAATLCGPSFSATAGTSEGGLMVLYSNDVHGETEPCG